MRGILYAGEDSYVFCCANREREIALKFGLFAVNMYACSYPETAIQVSQLAEEAGFESLWAGEHVVLPEPRVLRSPMDASDRILDPVVALTFLAAHTSRVRLG